MDFEETKVEEQCVGLDEEAHTEQEQQVNIHMQTPIPNHPIFLLSNDGENVELTTVQTSLSEMVNAALEKDVECKALTVDVGARVLRDIAEYLVHHDGVTPAEIEKPVKSSDMKVNCADPWDAEFIDRIAEERQRLYDLMIKANYLGVVALVNLGAAKIATLIRGQPLDRVRQILAVDQTENIAALQLEAEEAAEYARLAELKAPSIAENKE